MKLLGRLVLPSLLFVAASSAFASAGGNSNAQGQSDDQMTNLATYLLNLGGYLGYNLQVSPTETSGTGTGTGSSGNNPNTTISQTLLNLPAMQVITNYLFNTYLGALLVNTATPPGTIQFVPTNSQAYASINGFANYTFTTPPYTSSESASQVSVSTLLDQPPYQQDPVSQSILNILGTPDFSYCLDNLGTAVASSCTPSTAALNQYQVMINSIGTIPSTQTYFTTEQVQPLLGQLNSNSLITPLLYSTTSSSSASTSSGSGTPSTNQGLVAQSQAQQANNFIRFVTGAVSPMPMPNRNVYDNLFVKAQNLSKAYSPLVQQQAQAAIATYLTSLRVYAAQNSVGISNLYYIMSRRLPQNQGSSSSGQQTSQALSEFTMATWRLYNPDQTTQNTQWLAQINNASSATVQKEMAVLLAEINYQLYLSRQQQERLLLTNSLLLIQNARATRPNPNLNTPTSSSQGQ